MQRANVVRVCACACVCVCVCVCTQIPGPHAGRVGRDDVESDTEGTVSWNDSIEEIEDQEKSEVR